METEYALCAIEQDGYGMMVALLDLEYYLPARTAGRDGLWHESIGILGSDGQGLNRQFRMLGLRREDGRAFSAKS